MGLKVGLQFRVIFQEYAVFLIISSDNIFFKFGETFRKRYLPVLMPVFGYHFGNKRLQHGFSLFVQFLEACRFSVHGQRFRQNILRILAAAHGGHATLADMLCVTFAAELLVRLVVTADTAIVSLLFLLLFRHLIIKFLFRLQISAYYFYGCQYTERKDGEIHDYP